MRFQHLDLEGLKPCRDGIYALDQGLPADPVFVEPEIEEGVLSYLAVKDEGLINIKGS